MKLSSLLKAILLSFSFFLTTIISAQVKIGGNPKEDPHPSAVLELQSTDKGMLLPRVTQEQMLAIKDPADALIVYNAEAKTIYIYSKEQKQWMPLLYQSARLGGDSCEWEFDTTTSRVFLVRGYPLGDSVFYTTDTKKFVFSDRTQNTNSLGQDFPVTAFTGKYYFKATASRFTDSTNLNPTAVNVNFEVDSSGANTFFRGMNIAAVNNPKNNQTLDGLQSLSLSTIHAGGDTVTSMTGISNLTSHAGTGPTVSMNGFLNSTIIRETATDNVVSSIAGIRNSLSNASPLTKVTGNVFGYIGNTFFIDSVGGPTVTGNVYGIFLGNINGAAPKRNYAFYSSKGHNRFADSTLITDGFFTSPRAVLDINATSAMITPNGNTAQRPAAPVTAMFRYNNTGGNMEYYNGSLWKTLSSDSAEWRYHPDSQRVNLVRALPLQDTIFYSTQSRQFVFSDRNVNTNSLGQDFPVQAFGAKYTFKSTASKRDSAIANGSTMNVVYEADNSTLNTVFTSLSASSVINPKSFQKSDIVNALATTAIHAGNDSVQVVYGINNQARNSGNGRSGTITGILNAVRIQNGSGNNTGEMVGMRTIITRTGATAGRVTGNVYGQTIGINGLNGFIDGNIYGIFISNINSAPAKKNYAFYSSKGHNRLGDSTLITDGASISPRAVLDVNSTSAMIVPTGTTAQRPTVPVTGMVRYNTTNQTVEAYSGAQWNGIVRGSVSINIPNLPAATGTTMSVTVTGATTNSAVSVSPSVALPGGIIIAWSRVSAANTVEIRFENSSGAPVNPGAQNFNFRIIQ